MGQSLKPIHCQGIHTDSLGHYLVGLGLLAVVVSKWPAIRGCWRRGRFVLLTEDHAVTMETIQRYLREEWKPTPYDRWWRTAQKQDTKANSSGKVWKERSECPSAQVRILDAHIVGSTRNRFNPLLGTGGNIGKRDLGKAWKDADKLRSKAESPAWLDATITGAATVALPDFQSGGTWFGFANKTYNSGQGWYREGQLSPWSFLFALEGALLLVGSVNRRLGARSRPYAVFPFISQPSQPESGGEIGLSKGEFWAPLWEWPATTTEVQALFHRGLARLGGRAARAPHEFAVAALSAGVDGGVTEFARYELRHTTSAQVYEGIPHERIYVIRRSETLRGIGNEGSESDLLMELLRSGWLDRLPTEPRDAKQRGKFIGLRGPIEQAIIRIAEQPGEPERWQHLLLQIAAAVGRIDRNKVLRERCPVIPFLSSQWFEWAWPSDRRPAEIEMARAITSVGGGTDSPLLVNVFGVEVRRFNASSKLIFSESRPQRAVWCNGDPIEVLVGVVHRRLVDALESDPESLTGTHPCRAAVLDRLLNGEPSFDLELVAKWVSPLALMNWARGPIQPTPRWANKTEPLSGMALLDGLIRPIFQPQAAGRRLFPDVPLDQLPKAALARRVFHLLVQDAIGDAVQLVRNHYVALRRPTVSPLPNLNVEGRRLAAALLVPISGSEVAKRFSRWLEPGTQKGAMA